jgi:hypothetical protein
MIDRKFNVRKLTEEECEELQTLPRGYTKSIASTSRYAAIGNGWTVECIAHCLRHITLNKRKRTSVSNNPKGGKRLKNQYERLVVEAELRDVNQKIKNITNRKIPILASSPLLKKRKILQNTLRSMKNQKS